MAVTNYFTVNGQLYGEEAGGTFRGYVPDALGSVMATTTTGTSAQNTYRYKPYGEQLAKTGAAADPKFMWVGSHGYRSGLSTSYVRARHYARDNAAWTTLDPEWPFLDYPYVYADSNPSVRVDASGLFTTVGSVSCDDNFTLRSAKMIVKCAPYERRRLYYPFFCNVHPEIFGCPVYELGMTGAWPNLIAEEDTSRDVPCGRCREDWYTDPCKYYLAGPLRRPELPTLNCGKSYVTATKGACTVRVQIIDQGPHQSVSSGAILDLHQEAAKSLLECLEPKRKYKNCRDFGIIKDVTISA